MQTKQLTRILIVGILAVLAVLALSAVFTAKNEPDQEQVIQRGQDSSAKKATTSTESLNKISNSSDVENDIDVYIKSTESMPNPNDFNDSYSDLNR